MHLQRIPLGDLLPAPYNPRKSLRPGDPGWERLRRSMTEFDLVQPIVWNRRTGHVVGGHQRLAILRHEGRTEVECVVVDLPLEREQALNVALNNRNVGGDWDADKLVGLLTELQQLPDFDPTLTGFDSKELKDLLFVPAPVDAAQDPDEPAGARNRDARDSTGPLGVDATEAG
ncbi:MAG: ParB N-terminal domain-containing protein [Planctomycetaceae bacterium]